jgi:hypothetical protein
MRQGVLDVRGLDELEPAALDEGDVGARQLELEIEGVEAGTEQHGDLGQRHAFLAQLQDALADEARLVILVFGRNEQRLRAFRLAGEQHLGVALARRGDDRVGDVENRLRAAVVLFQRDDARVGEEGGEVHDVAKVRAAEGVDTLRIVADGHDIVVLRGQQAHDGRLQRIGVLVLVDQDEAMTARQLGAHALVVAQQLVQLDQQVVVVDDLTLGLVGAIRRLEIDQIVGVLGEMTVGAVDQIAQRPRLVHRHAEHLGDGLFAREALLFLVQPHARAQQPDHVFRVAAVENRERALEAERAPVAPQHEVGEGVERAPATCSQRPSAGQRRGAASRRPTCA